MAVSHTYRSLDDKLKELGYANYGAYLKSPHWESFRKKWVESGMPQRCIACSFPHYQLHHVVYHRLTQEDLGDVVPLCDRCHRCVHRYHKKHKLPLVFIDQSLRAIFLWDKNKCDNAFAPLHYFKKRRYAENDKRQQKELKKDRKEWKKKDSSNGLRDVHDYYKISRDLINFARYMEAGYSLPDLADIYKVPISYVKGYIKKFAHLFVGYPQLEEIKNPRKKST